MNIDQYSDRAKQAVQSAQSLALARRHQQFAPEHLLKILLEEKDGLSRALIQSAGGRPDDVATGQPDSHSPAPTPRITQPITAAAHAGAGRGRRRPAPETESMIRA